ncbi:hypothetical protein LWC34_06730 [Kibdelosporangium philippinense]|uniref:Uncharacterized protein n=1 Tax=Kibdelosporangium philippinense TaxID=211113 RepID=A0ABS8Z3L7_9PSEU|nr:hypothetical protein [Kibdelosporangium philippinense]MCE7002526.1 hypothetical protein [Kibdelosporangium philippinense]
MVLRNVAGLPLPTLFSATTVTVKGRSIPMSSIRKLRVVPETLAEPEKEPSSLRQLTM